MTNGRITLECIAGRDVKSNVDYVNGVAENNPIGVLAILNISNYSWVITSHPPGHHCTFHKDK